MRRRRPAPPGPTGRPARRGFGVVLVLALGAALSGCSSAHISSSGDTNFVSGDGYVTEVLAADRRPAPPVTGRLLEGGSFTLAADRGKIVVLNFWASWCGPCRVEGPALQVLAGQLAGSGVVFIGVDTGTDDPAAARAFLTDIHSVYPNIDDRDGQVALAFHGTLPPDAVPSTIVIDRQGRIAARVVGPTTLLRLRALLAPMLGGG